ncbi:unnamed protein product [Pseudo-nitzschia multistriata]|uniref:Deacetylase sirtuin-type domain-containing protein n=1 Tax=Pseudo-nitzschia multistriata TaxID=183589 RepID=A0A448ZA56_9STRA|nr:unnamed protein product [Pseudo-nitzschia multistriata]
METTTMIETLTVPTGKSKSVKRKNSTTKERRQKKMGIPPPFHLIQQSEESLGNPAGASVNDVLEGVSNLLLGKKNIVVLVGAGISTSVGIPDFRSKDKGLYNTLDAEALGLSCPEDLFCIEFFRDNPSPFYKFATHLYYPNKEKEESKSKIKNNNNRTSNSKNTRRRSKHVEPVRAPARKSRRIETKGELHKQQHRGEEEKQRNQVHSDVANHGMALPSDSHKLLALLEKKKMLLRVYTQNIDGLESIAGVSDSKIVYCHGSLKSMSCTKCSRKKLPLDSEILASIETGNVPLCQAAIKRPKGSNNVKEQERDSPARTSNRRRKRPRSFATTRGEGSDVCNNCTDGIDGGDTKNSFNNKTRTGNVCGGVLKPGITFFGETLDNSVARKIESDQHKADALIVIGTSLSVAPISKVIEYLPPTIPRILINRTIVHPKKATTTVSSENKHGTNDFRTNYVFDAYLLGFCDDVTRALGKQLSLGFDIGEGETRKENQERKANNKKRTAIQSKSNNHASAMAAKLLTSVANDVEPSLAPSSSLVSSRSASSASNNEWSSVTVPKERVILFPGALSNASGSAASDNEVAEEVYNEIAHCDGCLKQIPRGRPIFKCCRCFDFDLCQRCYPRVSKLHCNGEHTFRRE